MKIFISSPIPAKIRTSPEPFLGALSLIFPVLGNLITRGEHFPVRHRRTSRHLVIEKPWRMLTTSSVRFAVALVSTLGFLAEIRRAVSLYLAGSVGSI
jgi:hypothetical protein